MWNIIVLEMENTKMQPATYETYEALCKSLYTSRGQIRVMFCTLRVTKRDIS